MCDIQRAANIITGAPNTLYYTQILKNKNGNENEKNVYELLQKSGHNIKSMRK